MDVEALMQRAMQSWRDMGEQEAEEAITPVDEQEPAPVEQDAAEPAEESVNEPTEDVPEEPADESEPPETVDDSDAPEEPPTDPVVDETDESLPDPSEMPDSDIPESDTEQVMDLPDDPLDSVEELSAEDNDPVETVQVRVQDSDPEPDMSGDPQEDFPLYDDPFPVEDEGDSPSRRNRQQPIEVKMPDGWEAGISRTVQQRMAETQEIVTSHLDDELSRSIYQLDALGGD